MHVINRFLPAPHEVMSSYLTRLGLANRYDEPKWYSDFLSEPVPFNIDLLRRREHYQQLSVLTQLSVETIYSLTLHSIAIHTYPNMVAQQDEREYDDIEQPLYSTRSIGGDVHGTNARKICPLCWSEQPLYVKPWFLRYITTCCKHQVLLVDRCHICGKKLRIDALSRRCTYCQHRLSALPTTPISDDPPSLLLSTTMWQIATMCGQSHSSSLNGVAFDHPLQGMASNAVTNWLCQLGRIMLQYDPDHPLFQMPILPTTSWPPRPVLRQLAVADIHRLLRAVYCLLIDWPHSWHNWLDRILTLNLDSQERQYKRLPVLLQNKFAGSEWSWLQDDWEEFVRQHTDHPKIYNWLAFYRTVKQGDEAYLRQREAAKILGISDDHLKEFIVARRVRTVASSRQLDKRQVQLVDARSVEELRQIRASYLSRNQAAKYCGVSKGQLLALVREGLLTAEENPATSRSNWYFSQTVLDNAIQNIIGHYPIIDIAQQHKDNVWQFSDMIRYFAGAGITIAKFMVLAQHGVLPLYCLPECRNLKGIWCEPTPMKQAFRKYAPSQTSWLSASKVCKRLHCGRPSLLHYAASKLLQPYEMYDFESTLGWRYSKDDVDAFVDRYITVDEAAELLNCQRLTVQLWARQGRLPVVTGPKIDGTHAYRFDRQRLIEWRHERLTMQQTTELLGVSRATVHRWVEQGRLQPLDDMGGKQRWFARTDVEQIIIQ